jgi:hypothetical protein
LAAEGAAFSSWECERATACVWLRLMFRPIVTNNKGRKQLRGCADGRLMGMNFRKSLVVVLLGLGCAVAAHAQAGVYIGYTGTRLSGIECLVQEIVPVSATPPYSPLQCSNGANGSVVDQSGAVRVAAQNGNVNPSGIQFGGYYDFKTIGIIRLGVDVRGGDYHSNKSATNFAGGKNATGLDNVLVGVRGSFRTKYTWLSPYAQISAGYARSNATEPFGTPGTLPTSLPQPRYEDNFLMYEAFVGIDLHVLPLVDLRPVELGIGNMNRFGTAGGGDGPGSIGVKTIGAALVFHMPSH